jgi:tetratricopeptide (TPR) repeat protein
VSGRIEVIRDLLAKKPKDTFLVYSLGMELASAGRYEQAAAEFRRCIQLDPDYLPAYTEAGKALRSAGKLGQAREMFQAGIDLALRQQQSHARDYLQQQLDSLPRTSGQ